MAKVFLDTNYLIDALQRKPEKAILDCLENHIVYTSALSFHVYCYIYKIKVPDSRVFSQRENFQIIDFSESVLDKSLAGPTSDFEDNIQLHSAALSECDFFLTQDKKLLNLKFFGKTQLLSELPDRED